MCVYARVHVASAPTRRQPGVSVGSCAVAVCGPTKDVSLSVDQLARVG